MTRIDLTSKFRSALGRAWRGDEFSNAIECILKILPGSTVDWEPEESWASIHGGLGRVAIMWTRGPLVLVDANYVQRLRECVERFAITVEPVVHWDAKAYSVDMDSIDELFDTPGWDPEVVDPREMSASQLWYVTVN